MFWKNENSQNKKELACYRQWGKKSVYLKNNEERKNRKKKTNKVGEIFRNQNIANYSSLVRHFRFYSKRKGNHRQVLCKRVMCCNLQFANTFLATGWEKFWCVGER